MNPTRIFLSIAAIVIVAYFSLVLFEQEKKESNLRQSSKTVYAEILELKCGKRDFIRLRYNGKEIGKRIYLSTEECAELEKNGEIRLKIDSEGNIVFANNNYNDWSEAESFSILALGAFFIFCIVYYGIVAEVKKGNGRQ